MIDARSVRGGTLAVVAPGVGTTATGVGTGPVAQEAGGRTVAVPVVVMRDAPAAFAVVTGTVVTVAGIGTVEVIGGHVMMTAGRIVLFGTTVVMTAGVTVVSVARDGMTDRAVRAVFARTAARVAVGSTGTGVVVIVGSPVMVDRAATVGRAVRVDSSVTVVPAVGSGVVRAGSRRTTDRVVAGSTGVLGTPVASTGTVAPVGTTPPAGGISGMGVLVVGTSAMRVEADTGAMVDMVGTGTGASVTVPRAIGSTAVGVGMTGTSGIGAVTVGVDTRGMTVPPVGTIVVHGARPTIGRTAVVAAIPGTGTGGMMTRGARAVNGVTGPGGMTIVAVRIEGAATATDVTDGLIARVVSDGIGRVTVIVAVSGTGTAVGMKGADQMVSTVGVGRIRGGMTGVAGPVGRLVRTSDPLTKRVRTIRRSSSRRQTGSTRRAGAMSRG